jgi:hypothetical protein
MVLKRLKVNLENKNKMSLMFHNLINYIKAELKELVTAGFVLVLVLLAFAGYLKFVGLPMTRARNTYNEGMLFLMANDEPKAKQKFIDSLSYWKTPEAQAELDKLTK